MYKLYNNNNKKKNEEEKEKDKKNFKEKWIFQTSRTKWL